uniref:Uncharacterized protein n=1 Tax=Hot spring virus BHS1 TaxID=2024351 RepID=A0A2Y9CIC3_9VIRU|nr:hypothetical protein [Hot spring virus BHS1]
MGLEEFNIKPVVETEVKQDIRASQAPGYNAVLNKVEAEADFSGQVMYEDINYWLEALMGVATPTGSGPYVRTGGAPVTNAGVANPRISTIVKGDSADAYRLGGGILTELTISGEANKPLMVKGKMLGQMVTSGATLASLSDRATNIVMGDHVSLYIDSASGTIGSTLIASTGFAFELAIKTNRKLRHYLGSLTAGNWNDVRWDGSLKITAEFNNTSKAYLNTLLTNTVLQHQVRIRAANGPNLILQLDFSGALLEAPNIYDDRDGLATIDLNYGGIYNANLGNWLKYSSTCNVSTLP